MTAVLVSFVLAVVGLSLAVAAPASAVAPPAVTGLSAYPMIGAVSLYWTDPAGPDWTGTTVVYQEGRVAPTSPVADPAAGIWDACGGNCTHGAALIDELSPGTDYAFAVFPHDGAGNHGPGTPIVVYGSDVSLGASASTITYGQSTKLSGRLVSAASGSPIANQFVQLYARMHGSTAWSFVDYLQTNADGRYALTDAPPFNADYKVEFYGTDPDRGSSEYRLGATAGPVTVWVKPKVGINVNRTSGPLGTSFTFYGSVAPKHAGQSLRLQVNSGGVWRTVATRALSSASTTSYTIKPGSRKYYQFRWLKLADSNHVASASAVKTIRVY